MAEDEIKEASETIRIPTLRKRGNDSLFKKQESIIEKAEKLMKIEATSEDNYGLSISGYLKEITKRCLAEKLISEIFFYGKTDQLTINTTINNTIKSKNQTLQFFNQNILMSHTQPHLSLIPAHQHTHSPSLHSQLHPTPISQRSLHLQCISSPSPHSQLQSPPEAQPSPHSQYVLSPPSHSQLQSPPDAQQSPYPRYAFSSSSHSQLQSPPEAQSQNDHVQSSPIVFQSSSFDQLYSTPSNTQIIEIANQQSPTNQQSDSTQSISHSHSSLSQSSSESNVIYRGHGSILKNFLIVKNREIKKL